MKESGTLKGVSWVIECPCALLGVLNALQSPPTQTTATQTPTTQTPATQTPPTQSTTETTTAPPATQPPTENPTEEGLVDYYDLCLVDFLMPIMSGVACLTQVSQLD